jgi:MFS family permease
MFVYVFFMQFRPEEKTFVHGGGMIAAGLGALFQGKVTHWFDKKTAGYVAMGIGIFGGLWLLLVFTWLGLAPRAEWSVAGWNLPVGLMLFALGQWMWWFGSGMLGPVSMSMIADISEIHYLRSGVRKDELLIGGLMRGPASTSSPAPTGKRGALNPALPRWLQGYPVEWCQAAILAERATPKTRQKRASCASVDTETA